jgi:hypothetical protein
MSSRLPLRSAEQFGISPDTLYEWQAAHPGFSEALQSGKTPADAEMAASFYKRGLGYEQPAVKIFMPAGADAPVYAPYMEHYPGDVGAQKSWLFNRQRGLWQDRQSVDVGGTLEVRLANMTPDERAADAIALVQRIQARQAASRLIEGDADDVTDALYQGCRIRAPSGQDIHAAGLNRPGRQPKTSIRALHGALPRRRGGAEELAEQPPARALAGPAERRRGRDAGGAAS